MQFKLKQSSRETKGEVYFIKPLYKNKKESINFFNKRKYGILWKLSHEGILVVEYYKIRNNEVGKRSLTKILISCNLKKHFG